MFILIFIITIVILVVIHEFGHFFVAKKFGMKVLEFGFGIPPRAWGKMWGETLVSLNWLPFGGFVRILGEDEISPKDKDYERSFAAQSVLRRSLVVVAGVLMNLFLAFFLYYIVLASQNFSVQIPALADHHFVGINESKQVGVFVSQMENDFPNQKIDIQTGERIAAVNGVSVENLTQFEDLIKKNNGNQVRLTVSDPQNKQQRDITTGSLASPEVFIDSVNNQSPAQSAGLKKNERVVKIGDQEVNGLQQFASLIKENAGKEVMLTLSDAQGGNIRQAPITPRVNPPAGQGALGVVLRESVVPNLYFSEVTFYQLSYATPLQKIFAGPLHAYNLVSYSFQILGETVSAAVNTRDIAPVSNSVAGPIGITNILRQILAIKNPLIPYLDFMAAISLNLALVNILPFPGLDGGRFFFLLIEGITHKKMNETVERYIHTVGLVILIGLIFLITISDIRKLLPF